MKDNPSIQAEMERLLAEYTAGIDEGYSASPNAIPAFFYQFYVNMTARQRGYIFGRELRIQEVQTESESLNNVNT